LTDAEENVYYPGDECCFLYEHPNYGGSKLHTCVDRNSIPWTYFYMPDYNFHDKMSSWWCGKNVAWFMCTGTHGDCDGTHGSSGAGNGRSA